jgi:hypothetical protein
MNMSEDIIDHETQISAQAEQLLQRQQMLQDEARQVLEELDLVALLSKGGVLRKTGSSVLGLMVWRDIDLAVSSPGLSITRAYEVMHPLLTHPRVTQVRYFHQSDHFKEDDMDERLFSWCTIICMSRQSGRLISHSGLARACIPNQFTRLLNNN